MTEHPCRYGLSTTYKFSGDFDKALAELSKAIWHARDNYPIKALLTADASNGVRYVPLCSSSSPPPSRRRLNTDETYSRSSVAGEALSSYNRVHRDFANRPDTSISLSKFLKQKRIPERSFYRKKKIAELIILDRPRFDSLIKQIAAGLPPYCRRTAVGILMYDRFQSFVCSSV